MGVSQLYYTWADKGLQGRARFQFVAATRSLAGGPVPLQAVRAGLCGFPGVPQGEEAGNWVSMGWLDIGPTRFAFWRAGSGRTATRLSGATRSGNDWRRPIQVAWDVTRKTAAGEGSDPREASRLKPPQGSLDR